MTSIAPANSNTNLLILVKHAKPVLDAAVPPRLWRLGAEGEAQGHRLAASLERFLPFVVASSKEPKATRTAEIVAAQLGVPMRVIEGLEEFDRPALPLMSKEEHERLNAQIFEDPSKTTIGIETGSSALHRFSAAIDQAARDTPSNRNLVVVSHGTVIALFAAPRLGRDAFQLWKELDCGEFVALDLSEVCAR